MSISPDHYAGFLERIGHRVRNVGGLWWYNTSRGVYTSVPCDRDFDASALPVKDILGRDGVVARFGCSLEQGISSYRLVCDDRNYHVEQLRGWTRNQVKRSLEICQTEQIEFNVLERHGISLNADTLLRQGRKIPANLETYWQSYFREAGKTEGAETWGTFVDGQLAAYLISFTIEDIANILIVRSSAAHLKKCPNNALLYRFLHDRLRDDAIREVRIGYASIQTGLDSLDQFKLRMGFRMAPAGQRVEIAGWLRPFVNRFTTTPACRLLRKFADGETVAKFEGMLKWYQEQPDLLSNSELSRAA